MGPLVPDIIGNQLNLVVALFIGMLFGAILEQAGFSASRKLAGLFYGYDFTVLRVFFTAGVVSMFGVIAFDHFGIIDINLTYINPTFFWSAIVGGLIMGLGFILGGFCPGTGLCAAAIGKIDGIFFVIGSFLGVFVFAEGYPVFEGIYKAANWGNVRIFETLNMPQGVFAFLLTSVAVFAFWATSIIENRVNGIKRPAVRFTPYYVSLGVIGGAIALSSFVLPQRQDSLLKKVEDREFINQCSVNKITPDELAYRIMDNENNIQIFDFRNVVEFTKFHLPKSVSFKAGNLFEKEPVKALSTKGRISIFTADDELTAKKMAVVAQELGFDNIRILEGGLSNFKSQILDFDTLSVAHSRQEMDTYRFRTKARKVIPVMIEQAKKSSGVVKTAAKRVIGGC
ncbi:MAG: YeeE/YedE family protein [Ignavibacteria bacterium]|nr:YeeE/YedE family protein [Ignavibacteria bacterium]MCU7504620.1 YeeE/YedE family protein [Ignavibacteria bacterium]MCU7517964.1 YeeE/YedE family protein [Ignavibacteria bacterium]